MEHTNNSPFSSLFEQAAQISKASAYDIIVKQRDGLLQENERLRKVCDNSLETNEKAIEAIGILEKENTLLKEQNRTMKEALQEIATSKVWSMGESLQTAANALNKVNS